MKKQTLAPSPKLAALIHAAVVGGDTGFFLLNVGEKFRFPGDEDVCTKTSNLGWYKEADGRKFRTGTATAVIRVVAA
jgi:hypothetical protein